MKALQAKTCSSCGMGFNCGPKAVGERCWCDYELPLVSLVADDQDCLCPACLPTAIKELVGSDSSARAPVNTNASSPPSLVAGEDYYAEGAAIVFTAQYHLRRGYCCENDCRHCPY